AVDEARIGVEPGQAAVDHVLHQGAQLLVGELVDEILLHLVEDVDQEPHALVLLVVLGRRSAVGNGQAKETHGGGAEQAHKMEKRVEGGSGRETSSRKDGAVR